jgi:ABC-type sugar transport system permease subunit
LSSITTSTPANRAIARYRNTSLRTKQLVLAYVLVAPVVLWRMFTTVYPFIATLLLSFQDNSPVRRKAEYIGLTNYQNLLQDTRVRESFVFTLSFTAISVALQILLGLGIAELLNRQFRGRNIVRAINLLPWAISGIVIGTAGTWIFNTDYGLVNDIIWRISGQRPLWLVDPFNAQMAVVMTDVWKNTAFVAVIFLGGLQGISAELYEAAKIDGANGMQRYRFITIPLLLPLILSMTIFISIFRVLTFEIIYALTAGGPGSSTSVMSYAVYLEGFRVLNFGYASSIAMLLFVMVLIIGVVGFVFLRRAVNRL